LKRIKDKVLSQGNFTQNTPCSSLKEKSEAMNPKKYYVYFHRDTFGNIFYIGKGTGSRAWDFKKRHDVWKRYIRERLHGKYTVEIFQEGLSNKKAEDLESLLINKYGENLINWENPKRQFNYENIDLYNKKRHENLSFVKETKKLEKENPSEAIKRYKKALSVMREYEGLILEKGIVAEMMNDEWNTGDWEILDRLTICLIKTGEYNEAIQETEKYFQEFPGIKNLKTAQRITKRIEKIKNQKP